MKKLLLLFTAVLFLSCSEDDNEPLINDEAIGTWHNYKTVITVEGEEHIINVNEGCDNDFPSIKFKNNLTGTVYVSDGECNIVDEEGFDWSKEENGEYHINGGEVIYTITIQNDTMTLTPSSTPSNVSYYSKIN